MIEYLKLSSNQKKQLFSKEKINKLVASNVELTYDIRDSFLRGDLSNIGKNLDKAWGYKKKFSNKISNKRLDKIYDSAINSGASGGKLLGAGGGGFFIFYCSPEKRVNVINKLKSLNTKIVNFDFESEGLISWTVRR